jgi:hypothetical protein
VYFFPLLLCCQIQDQSAPRKDHRGVDLISDVLPLGRLWYGEPNAINNAVNCAGGERFEKASKSLDKRKD